MDSFESLAVIKKGLIEIFFNLKIRWVFNMMGKFKILAVLLIVVIVVAAAVALYSSLGVMNPEANETQNDVQTNIGSNYPDMVDMVSASIEKQQTTLTTTIRVKEAIISLGEQETVQFNMIAVLENEEDALRTYELIVDINATGIFGFVQDVQTKQQYTAELSVEGDTLTITTTLNKLADASQVEWSIYSIYEKLEGNQLVCSAYDFVPDEGMRTTTFEA